MKKKIKIFQVFESYPSSYATYIPPTLDLLSKQEYIDSNSIVFKGDSSPKNVFIIPNYKKRSLYDKANKLFFPSKGIYNYLERKALRENIDLIHIQHSYLFTKVKGFLDYPEKKQPKIVITLRGGDTYIKPWISMRWQDFYKNYGEKVDAFVVMSEHQKLYLSRWNVPLEKIHVIPISFGQPFKVEPKYPNQDKLKIASVFRMCWEKNIADNLRLIKKIKELGVSLQYDVYGDGPDMGQLYYLLDRYGLNDVVNVMGKVENSFIKSNINNYDFVLQLSHSEAFPTSILEAQSHGVPAIVSNAGGLPELVCDKKNGLIGDFNNLESLATITVNLWKDKNQYFTFSELSIKNAQDNYNTRKEVNSLVSLYNNLQ
jgi:glycosyltransferase involved in cell wall biosynthesis